MSVEDPGMWRQLFDWAWAIVLGLWAFVLALVSLVYWRQEKDLEELKAGAHALRNRVVTKEEFIAHEVRDQRDREERRSSELLLFQKFDALKDEMNGKFDSLKTLILEMRR